MIKEAEKIKAVVFDVGGVLALHIKEIHREVAAKLNLSFDDYMDAIDSAYAKSMEGKISKKQTLEHLSKNFKKPKKEVEKIYFDSYKKSFTQNKQLYNLAFNLKKQKHKIGILSDQWHLSKNSVIPEKYSERFDVVVVSCDVGVRKPDLKIYKLFLKKIKLPAKNVLFIDNRQWNLTPAKKLGMKTILFRNNKQLFKEIRKFLK
ncbi:MAG: HAD-IA family hydrolase [archaeon]